jgi:hypothetical protein
MSACRSICAANGWVPLYHYTMPALGELILNSGLRMSTQGQGDGGVYLSLLGTASFQVLPFPCIRRSWDSYGRSVNSNVRFMPSNV